MTTAHLTNEATIGPPAHNGRNLSTEKELIHAWHAVVGVGAEILAPISIRWWMGRSSSASVVYCTVRVRGDGYITSGHGTAGGGGYDKRSSSLSAAIRSAGIELSEDIDGRGDMASREALAAILRAIGYTDCPYLIVES